MSDKYKIKYLNKQEFSLWDSFVDECEYGSVFYKSLWLESIYKHQKNITFRIIGCFDKNSKLVGGFAFGFKKKYNLFPIIVPPSLTPYFSILIKERPSQYNSKTENYRLTILENISQFLNKHYAYIPMYFPPAFPDIRIFEWNKFTSKVKYTYGCNLEDPNAIFESFDPDVKRQIKKLENDYTINKDDSITAFFNLQSKSFQRQEHKFKLSKNQLTDFSESIDDKNFKVYTISELDNPVYSAIMLFYKETAFYWLAGGDPDFFAKGYNKALLWEIILDLKEKGIKHFDLMGANTPSIRKYKSNFGFELIPYYSVEKINTRLLKVLFGIKRTFKKN